jgi:hexosaminidase
MLAASTGLLLSLFSSELVAKTSPSLVPQPLQMKTGNGSATVHNGDRIIVDQSDAKALWVARYMADLLATTVGLNLDVHDTGETRSGFRIELHRDLDGKFKTPESYALSIGPSLISISASGDAGLFYGAATLWQTLTQSQGGTIQSVQIQDTPRFRWRGMMIDSARHFQSPEFIKKLLNVMALHKLNVLHWHLTDDQAWRLEIKKYPLLTSIGAWRVPAGVGPASDIDSATGQPRLYGGFYSQDQVRDIVQFAKDRGVTIVPEIEMPGHASAAITAYPALGSAAAPTAISSDWGVFLNIYNVSNSTFTFLENVLDEVMALFPGKYIHVGGDEAVKDQWAASPEVQALKKQLGLTSDDAVQSWFINKIGSYLEDHGRHLIGWDEILNGGLGNGSAVMSWHGLTGANSAAKQGHDTVVTAAPDFYFDTRMNNSANQPPGVSDQIITLKDVYGFQPMPAGLSQAQRKHVLGLEGAVWTEHMRTETQLQRTSFPRELAIAELGWTASNHISWASFLGRLPAEFTRLKALKFQFSDSPFEPRPIERFNSADGSVRVTLANQTSFGEIHYTLDDTAPKSTSPVYHHELHLRAGSRLRAATYDGTQLISNPIARDYDAISVRSRNSHELGTCAKPGMSFSLEDDAPAQGPRALFNIDMMAPCWIYKGADLTGITSLTATVGQLPFNFQIGSDVENIHFGAPQTPYGELEVRLDSCDGPMIASIPLQPAVLNPATTVLPETAIAPLTGQHDLCYTFTQSTIDPVWAIDRVGLIPE